MKKKINPILHKGRGVGCLVLAGTSNILNSLEKVGTSKVGTSKSRYK